MPKGRSSLRKATRAKYEMDGSRGDIPSAYSYAPICQVAVMHDSRTFSPLATGQPHPQCTLNSRQALFWITTKGAFPDTNDGPTLLSEKRCHASVPRLIAANLFGPGLSVCARCNVLSTCMTVPKASINEHGNPASSPCEVRLTKYRLMRSPA